MPRIGFTLDLDAARRCGIIKSRRCVHACGAFRSTCEDLDIISILAAVYFTLEEVCSLDWLAFLYDADNDTVDLQRRDRSVPLPQIHSQRACLPAPGQ